MYDYNYTAAVEMGYDAAMANRSSLGGGSSDPIKCYSRNFNLTQYQSTVVTEWDLVCERRVIYSTTQSAVMGGNLAGNIIFGYGIDVWLPESPRWLIVHGHHNEALKVLKQAAKLNGKALPPDDQIMSAITFIQKQSRTQEEGEKKVFVLSRVLLWLRRLGILLVLPQYRTKTLILFVGFCSSSIVYYGVTLGAHNVNTEPYLYLFLGGISEVSSSLLLWLVLVRLGRRAALVVLLLVCGVTIFLVMALVLTGLEGMEWAAVTLSQVGKLAIASAFQLLWVYTAELYPTKYRSLAVGLGNMFARVGGACAPYINDLMGAKLVWGPLALFASVSLLSAVLMLLLPETRHMNLTEPKDWKATEGKREEAGSEILFTSQL